MKSVVGKSCRRNNGKRNWNWNCARSVRLVWARFPLLILQCLYSTPYICLVITNWYLCHVYSRGGSKGAFVLVRMCQEERSCDHQDHVGRRLCQSGRKTKHPLIWNRTTNTFEWLGIRDDSGRSWRGQRGEGRSRNSFARCCPIWISRTG